MTESREKPKESEDHTVVEIHGLSNLQLPMNSFFAFLGPNGAVRRIKLFFDLTRHTSGGRTILGHELTTENKRILV